MTNIFQNFIYLFKKLDQPQKEASVACKLLTEAIALRKKYVFTKQREDWSTSPPLEVKDANTQVYSLPQTAGC